MGATEVVTARTERELLAVVRAADETGVPLFLTSAAPGYLASQGRSVRVAITGMEIDETGCDTDDLVYCGAVQVTAAPGEQWDDLVARAVQTGWVGVEALSWLPGSVTDAVRYNAAAYGQSVADVVVSVRTWDRAQGAQRTFPAVDCSFALGSSRFQETLVDGTARYVILGVSLLLPQGELTKPVRDPELAALLGVTLGERVELARVREALSPHADAPASGPAGRPLV